MTPRQLKHYNTYERQLSAIKANAALNEATKKSLQAMLLAALNRNLALTTTMWGEPFIALQASNEQQ